MSGKSGYLLDTNIIIDILKNRNWVTEYISDLETRPFSACQIARIELLCHPFITDEVEKRILEFLNKILVFPITYEVECQAILLRRKMKLKIPDALIVATAIVHDYILVTRDQQLFHLKYPELEVWSPIHPK